MTHFFTYGEEEVAYLHNADARLGAVMDAMGPLRREVIPDLFQALVNTVIGQQISTKAQVTVWARFLEQFAPVTPRHIAALPLDTLRTCGISTPKARYIQGIARAVEAGQVDLTAVADMPDELAIRTLGALPGIGRWSAQMLLLFSLQRPDVVSHDDLGIRRGMCKLYHHRELTPRLFQQHARCYSPYGSVASLYLWEIAK